MEIVKYNRSDIIDRTSIKLGIHKDEIKFIMDGVFDTIKDMLIEDESYIHIELRNFGVFDVKPTKPKPRARNPQTNEEFYVPSRRKLQFRAGKIIRKQLNKEWIIE